MNGSAAVVMDPNDQLEMLGQQPGLKIYTQICLCFSVADASSHPAILDKLRTGLERLSASFPWVAGQLVNEGAAEGNSGIFSIKPLDKTPPLTVKDLSNDPSMPTMDALRKANFPFAMLDESIIAPRNTLPGPDEPAITPVFPLQATFITGGLLLTFCGQHNSMDMVGQGEVMRLLSKACRGDPFTASELATGNPTRRDIIPLLSDDYRPGAELAHQVATPSSANPESTDPPAPPLQSSWAYFAFGPTELVALKSLATKTLPAGTAFISTDDALTAYVWQSVTRARVTRLNPTSTTTISRAVDVRRFLNVPSAYPGLMQNVSFETWGVEQLAGEELGVVAGRLRGAVDPATSTLEFRTRALATVMARSPDKSVVSFIETLDSAADIFLSSWVKVECYKLDFGLGLGAPEAVRRPGMPAYESLIYLLPKRPDGEIVVGICLRDADMKRLRADEEFAQFASYIG